MVSGINAVNTGTPLSNITSIRNTNINQPLTSFDIEDKAIISAQAKLLNELDKFNSGEGDIIDLAVTRVESQNQVEAMVHVINTKTHMMDKILEIGKDH